MDKTVEYDDDVTPVKIKKKSKKNKNISVDLLHAGDGDSNVETDGDNIKKDKHSEKRNLESKEDEEIDSDHITRKKKDKKKKSESKEVEEEIDDENIKRKKKEKKKKSESNEDEEEIDDANIKKKKKDKKKKKSESKEDGDEDQHDEGNLVNGDLQKKKNNKKRKRKENDPGQTAETDVMKKKKKKKIDTENPKESPIKTRDMEYESKKKEKVKNKSTEAKSKTKRVSFSGHVEVFPILDTDREKHVTKKDGLLRGVRFTPEEDEKVKQAVYDYINVKGLGDDGLHMVLNCKFHKELKGCWKEIGESIPYRPVESVYLRAHVLLERSKDRSWTTEEYEMLKKLHAEHGNDWKKLSHLLGRDRHQLKDTWRRIKLAEFKQGRWSRDEYQNLYDLVNLDLKLKVVGEAEKHSKHGMLRDNIQWRAISDKLTSRSDTLCCVKWYNTLTSSLVAEKKWSDADDYRMIGALCEIDAACVDDVDWDSILEHRSGEICLKRWNQMVKHVGDYASKSFCELVDILSDRYCPDMAQIREEWDNKPYVM